MEIKLIKLKKETNYKVINYLYKTGKIKGKKKLISY
uniref:Cytochrome b6-f complex subunit petP n=1 Tax=Caulacanthus okamurae TaxID=152008 RepID=A0A6H1U9E2_9FLOR|nr:cytochrome b6-f complex subunit petP [Caulacanthus okamurae]QIZ74673.1 cytochrome b6-f complex subunit petP [Caulacanthus okamurae]